MMTTKVTNYYLEKNGIYIGRGSIWGNPASSKPSKYHVIYFKTSKEAIEYFETYLLVSHNLLNLLPTLIGQNLRCFCKTKANPDRMCHGDVLKYYADKLESGTTIEQIKSGQIPRLFPISKV